MIIKNKERQGYHVFVLSPVSVLLIRWTVRGVDPSSSCLAKHDGPVDSQRGITRSRRHTDSTSGCGWLNNGIKNNRIRLLLNAVIKDMTKAPSTVLRVLSTEESVLTGSTASSMPQICQCPQQLYMRAMLSGNEPSSVRTSPGQHKRRVLYWWLAQRSSVDPRTFF